MKQQRNLLELDCFVFIDVSNIRYACLRGCQIRLDFRRLYKYFSDKYPDLKAVKYFEGISDNDTERQAQFKKFEKIGYEVCSLSRKAYINPAVHKNFKCKKCKAENRVKVLSKTEKLKSNVDVYIASELLRVAYLAKKPTHIILMSCDGDYAEMIRLAIESNKYVDVTVLATPSTRKYNALSVRLKQLRSKLPSDRYRLDDITNIRDKISAPSKTKRRR
jgi:uncharacterized LabA/DUF88 family protein